MLNETARDASTQTEANPKHLKSPWTWDLIKEKVPALPCGAVTLIVLYGDDPWWSSHAATVGDLIKSVMATQQRMAYVGLGDPGPWVELFAAVLNGTHGSDDQVIAHVDRDHKVMARLGDGTGLQYSCGVPTLDNVDTFLAGDEYTDERLLILDGFERARPYAADGPLLIPAAVPMTGEDIDAWRAADLRAFAASRPNAPTVVVWTSTAAQSPETKRSIGDAADVMVHYIAREEGDGLAVTVRSAHGCWEDHD